VSSVALPVKQLYGFARVNFDVNETKKVAFKVNMKQLAFHDLIMDQVVKPRKMEVFIGEKLIVERKEFSSKVPIVAPL
jgi:beta-glucosidase